MDLNKNGITHLVEISPLEVKRNKKDTGWSCSVLVMGTKKVAGKEIPVQDVSYVSSNVQLEANKTSLCEVALYAIEGELITKILKVRKTA